MNDKIRDEEEIYVRERQEREAHQRTLEQLEFARELLGKIAEAQDRALGYIEANGFVFDDIGKEPGNWKHLAFSLYSDLCEVDTWAHAALDLPLGETPDTNPASEPLVTGENLAARVQQVQHLLDEGDEAELIAYMLDRPVEDVRRVVGSPASRREIRVGVTDPGTIEDLDGASGVEKGMRGWIEDKQMRRNP